MKEHIRPYLSLSVSLLLLSACGGDDTDDAPCADQPHASASVSDGACVYTCDAGYENTGTAAAPDCQAQATTGCAEVAHASSAVQDGACVYTCDAGYENTGSAATPSCEFSCTAVAHASVDSSGGCTCDEDYKNTGTAERPVCVPSVVCEYGELIRDGTSEDCPNAYYCYQADRNTAAKCVFKEEFVMKLRWTPSASVTELPIHVQRVNGTLADVDIDCNSDGDYDFRGLSGALGNDTVSCPAEQTEHTETTLRGYIPFLSFGASREQCASVDGLVITQWGKNPWRSLAFLFAKCENLSFEATDSPNLINTESITHMCWQSKSFNEDISGWDMGSVKNMAGAFRNTESFNQDISGWDVSSVTHAYDLFQDAAAFNQDISGWDVSAMTDVERMFDNAAVFNQDLSSWEFASGATCGEDFATGSGMSEAQLPATCQ